MKIEFTFFFISRKKKYTKNNDKWAKMGYNIMVFDKL